jgi:hypothetical protein
MKRRSLRERFILFCGNRADSAKSVTGLLVTISRSSLSGRAAVGLRAAAAAVVKPAWVRTREHACAQPCAPP